MLWLSQRVGRLIYPGPEDSGAPVADRWREEYKGWLPWEVPGKRRDITEREGARDAQKWGPEVGPLGGWPQHH